MMRGELPSMNQLTSQAALQLHATSDHEGVKVQGVARMACCRWPC